MAWREVMEIRCCVVAWCAVQCSVVKCRGVPCGKLDVVKWRVVPSRGVTRSDGNLERVEVSAVNAPIVAHCDLVAALDVTAAADGFNHGVGQERVNKGFHCSLVFG